MLCEVRYLLGHEIFFFYIREGILIFTLCVLCLGRYQVYHWSHIMTYYTSLCSKIQEIFAKRFYRQVVNQNICTYKNKKSNMWTKIRTKYALARINLTVESGLQSFKQVSDQSFLCILYFLCEMLLMVLQTVNYFGP